MKFINLRNYSENSILNAAIRVPDLVAKAKEVGHKAVALTDKSGYGMVAFYNACNKAGIKPLYGLNGKTQGGLHNILVFPKSDEGKVNMFNLLTDFNTEKTDGIGKYKDNLDKLKDVIIIVDYNTFKQFPEYYNIIQKENFFVELQTRNTDGDYQDLKKLVDIKNIIITSPVYYLNDIFFEDKESGMKMKGDNIMKIMKSIETGKPVSEIQGDFNNLYWKTEEEIRNEFLFINDDDYKTILNNIDGIVEAIDFKLDLDTLQIPVFEIEGEARKIYDDNKDKTPHLTSDEWYIRYLTYLGINERYGIDVPLEDILMLVDKKDNIKLEKVLSEYKIPELKQMSKDHWHSVKKEYYAKQDDFMKEIIDRAEYELIVMHFMGFDAYFLIVSDYIIWARNNGDLVGPGRGSAAGSLVSFLCGITDIDPLKYELLFERFLNPARVSPPDVDTDFSNRDAVIKYCSKKYGEEYVTPVITYGKLTAKSVLKGVGKATGIGFSEINRLTSKITGKEQTGGAGLAKIYEENEEFRNHVDSANEYKHVFDLATNLEGFKQQTGQHACAVIIAPKPVTDFCPLQFPTDKKGNIKQRDRMITQLDGSDLEAQGLLKMDFLGLQNLTIMNDCCNIVKKHKGIDINLSKVDVDDQKVYENIFQSGKTTNVFQFESTGMKKYLKGLKPTNLDDLIAMVSLYRPGPIKFIQTYINRKHGIEPVIHPDPVLEPIMGKTYGICVTGDSKVLFEDGTYSMIKDIVDNKENIDKKVLSVNMTTNKIESNKINHLFNNGEKEFLEISLNDRSIIKTTAEHKFLIYRGITENIIKIPFNKRLDDDIFMTLRNIPESNNKYSLDKLLIIAYLLGDGYIGHSSAISFINKDKIILDNFTKAINTSFPTSHISISQRKNNVLTYSITDSNNRNNSDKTNTTLLTYLRDIKLKEANYKDKGLVSHNKHIPNFIFNLDNNSINHFIAKLWDCDGGIDKNGYGYYTTISKQLVNDLSLLLKKVGISTKISIEKNYITCKGEIRTPFHLIIKDKIKFNNTIGILISSIAKKERFLNHLIGDFKTATKIDYIPKNILQFILEKNYKNVSINSIDKSNYLQSLLNSGKSLITRERFNKLFEKEIFKKSDLDNIPKIQEIINNYNFFTIDSVKNIGKEIAYDLEINNNNNYIVGNVCITNCVYQEQIMKMAQDLAGYSLGEADLLRRAVGKKKKKIILEQREIFVKKSVELDHDEETVGQIYDDMILPAAEYSFNKSHAACYAYIAYQGALLKTYYPAEYMVAILMTQGDDLERAVIAVEDAILEGIEVVPLDVNISEVEYKYINDKKIQMGLKVIKGCGEADMQKVVDERDANGKYEDFDNFIQRNKSYMNKKILEGLLMAGALDDLIDQNTGLHNVKRMLAFLKKQKKNPISTQVNLFSMFDGLEESGGEEGSTMIELDSPEKPTNPMTKSMNEYIKTGFMLRNHPFDGIKSFVEAFERNRDTLRWNKNSSLLHKDKLEVRGVAIITELEVKKSQAGKTLTKIKLLGTDYYIGAMMGADLTHKFEYELLGKSRDNPAGLFKMIEFTGKYSLNDYGRGLFITDINFKDINQAYKVADTQGKYNKNDKCSWNDIIAYKNEVLDYHKAASILISDFLLKPENADLYKEKIGALKEFLLRYHTINGEYNILLKTFDGKVKDTELYINTKDKDTLINYVEKTSGFKIVGIKKTSEEDNK